MSEDPAKVIGDYCTTYNVDGAEPSVEALCALHDIQAGANAGLDVFFLLFAGAAVFLMQAGFAMLCAGSIRSKNVKNIMLKNLLDACGGALGFFFLGYGLAYGKNGTADVRFIGNADFLLLDTDTGEGYIFFFFQFAFAATAATIVAGTVAERCKMSAYLCYSVFLTAFVYPVIVHAGWASDGFLSAFNTNKLYMDQGALDFAGSAIVHLTGGTTALIAAVILGPRRGRFYDDDGNPLDTPGEIRGHSAALQVLGTFLLWFGWYGFNPGSALKAAPDGYHDVMGLAAVTTTLAAASGAISALAIDTLYEFTQTGEVSYEITMAMNGSLGGLVAITAGCSVIQPWLSVIVGFIGGIIYFSFSKFLVYFRIDDAVDAIPVHFANGIWGVLAVGLFSDPVLQGRVYSSTAHHGWFYNFNDATLLLIELILVLFVIAWVSACMIPFFVLLKCFGLFRVDPLEEEVGLDVSHHRGSAYYDDGPTDDAIQALNDSRHGRKSGGNDVYEDPSGTA